MGMPDAPPVLDPATLQADATALLRALVGFNTVNPPGNERAAQEYLAAQLQDAGFEVTLVGRTEPRPNLVARLRGAAGRTEPVPALARRHRPGQPRRMAARPVVR